MPADGDGDADADGDGDGDADGDNDREGDGDGDGDISATYLGFSILDSLRHRQRHDYCIKSIIQMNNYYYEKEDL